jgi:hypothetical protein
MFEKIIRITNKRKQAPKQAQTSEDNIAQSEPPWYQKRTHASITHPGLAEIADYFARIFHTFAANLAAKPPNHPACAATRR